MNATERIRLFTALWPDPAVRAQLAALRDAWGWSAGARPVADAKLHATLHFIGAFPRDSLAELGAALARVPVEPVQLHASGSDVFRGGIAVALLEAGPALADLHARIGEVLAGLGVALEERPYRPHVTLARRAGGSRPPGRWPPLAWRADGFVLVHSRGGSYEVLATPGAGFT